ncbi:MAG: signal peptidase I [Promicromonosporaceae bacterium]|nr:signal peptidase I [Promicromonosporaceae bacterium]
MRRLLKLGGQALSAAGLLLCAGILIAGVLVPRVAGATGYEVMTGSMVPTYPPGTLVVVRPVDPADLEVGDVITFQEDPSDPAVVTHRIVARQAASSGGLVFRTKGDANDDEDPVPITSRQIHGRVWYTLPYLGRVTVWLTTYRRQLVYLGFAVGLLGYSVWQVCAWRAEKRRARARHLQPKPT